MSGIVALGKTAYLASTSAPSSVTFAPSISNTFRIVNTSTTVTVFVGVYNDSTAAAAIAKPTAGAPVSGVIAIAPGWNEVISGNFGAANTATIYVAAVSDSAADIYIAPLRD